MKFNREDLEAICFEDYASFDYEIIEDGEWAQDGKFQTKKVIFKTNDKYYSVTFDRSGSPFTDWEYGFEYMDTECPEVEKKEIVTSKWVIKVKK